MDIQKKNIKEHYDASRAPRSKNAANGNRDENATTIRSGCPVTSARIYLRCVRNTDAARRGDDFIRNE